MNGLPVLLGDHLGGYTIFGSQNLVASILQELPEHFSEGLGILHQEDGLRSRGDFSGGFDIAEWLCHGLNPWQANPECRAVSQFAVDRNTPSALLHDAIDHRESQPRSFTRFLGREEWLEDSGLRAGIHSATRITDLQHYVGADGAVQLLSRDRLIQVDIGGTECQLASLGHGVASVDGKV